MYSIEVLLAMLVLLCTKQSEFKFLNMHGVCMQTVCVCGMIVQATYMLITIMIYCYRQMSSEESLHNGAIPVVPLPLTNPTYDGPPDYQEVMSERNSYYKWKKVFSGMIVKSSNLRYGEQLGEGVCLSAFPCVMLPLNVPPILL